MKWEIKDNIITITLENKEKKKYCTCETCKKPIEKKDYENEALDSICSVLDIDSEFICLDCKASLITSFTHNYLSFHKDGKRLKEYFLSLERVQCSYFNEEDEDFLEEWWEVSYSCQYNSRNKEEIILNKALEDKEYIEYAAINGLRKIVEKLSRKQSGE